jgi:ketosteroid isomerase-like protein
MLVFAPSLVSFLLATAGGGAFAENVTPLQRKIAQTVVALDKKWVAAVATHNLDKTVAFYSPNAVMLAPNTPIANTPTAIRQNWVPFCAPTSKVVWRMTKVVVARSGEMAYCYGTYTLSLEEGGKTIRDKGKEVEIWERQHDGSWKCAVDMFNSDLPKG